jgi:hypothetical protein
MPLGSQDEFSPMTWSGGAAFFAVLRDAAKELLAMHDVAPRVVRYVASMQKWLITQAIIALHFERKHDETRPPLTAGSLIEFFAAELPFSKNTLTAHLAEMGAYGLLVPQESKDRRVTSTGSMEAIERPVSAATSACLRASIPWLFGPLFLIRIGRSRRRAWICSSARSPEAISCMSSSAGCRPAFRALIGRSASDRSLQVTSQPGTPCRGAMCRGYFPGQNRKDFSFGAFLAIVAIYSSPKTCFATISFGKPSSSAPSPWLTGKHKRT